MVFQATFSRCAKKCGPSHIFQGVVTNVTLDVHMSRSQRFEVHISLYSWGPKTAPS